MDTPPDGTLRFVAGPDDAGTRLDRFLAQRIGTLSRTRVKSLVEGGHATANARVAADPAASVQPGTWYALLPPPALPASPVAQAMALAILFEDADLLVLDKPAGLVVHPAPGNPDGTLVNALLAHCGDTLPGIGGERRPGIVHRLDKDTSGVMVVAKSDTAMAALGHAFATRDLERSYLALCWGMPAPSHGELSGPIGRDPRERKRMAVVARGGKAALTTYALCRSWQASVALIELPACHGADASDPRAPGHGGPPHRGRPVVPATGASRSPRPCAPAAGHAAGLPAAGAACRSAGVPAPGTGAALRFETAVPADFRKLVNALDGAATGCRLIRLDRTAAVLYQLFLFPRCTGWRHPGSRRL